MNERFDLRAMLQEIVDDDKVHRARPVLLTQKEIVEMQAKLRRKKAAGSREK